MTHFTPLSATLGGVLIGLASVLLWRWDGRIAGISGIAAGLTEPRPDGGHRWRLLFLAGLVAGTALWFAFGPVAAQVRTGLSPAWLVGGGLLVGLGTRLANGCTSGHGVCGLARLSLRSLVAVGVFLATAIVTTGLVRHVFKGLFAGVFGSVA